MTEEALLSVREAAGIAHMSIQRIHKAIREGKLKAQKLGWVWVIYEGDLIEYLDSRKVKNTK